MNKQLTARIFSFLVIFTMLLSLVGMPSMHAGAVKTYVLTIAVYDPVGGTTNPSAGTYTYHEGQVVSVKATPNPKYTFYGWSGDYTGTGDCSVKMDADKTVLATFAVVPAPAKAAPAAKSASVSPAATITFTGSELLGSPEANQISIKVLPDSNITMYYQYGTSSGSYPNSTSHVSATGGTPITVTLTGLTANTHYYYRMQYSTDSGSTWTARSEHSFWTQRAKGSTFVFDITTDSHVNIVLGSASAWTQTMNDVASDNPDFQLDLGDTFAMDSVTSQATADTNYKFQYQFFNLASANTPLFIASGNHEQVEGWHMTASTGYHLPALATNSLKTYYLNPEPDSFYSGDSSTNSYINGDGMRNDYYAWTWGDALFVVYDPYWFSTTKPYTSDPGGGKSDTTGSGNIWDWTLGLDQYNWLINTLSGSNAKYKFLFAHQIVSSDSISGQALYGHGGADAAKFGEWGGYNTDGTTYTWSTNRASSSGWGSNPIANLMANYNVTAFFHGHDHQYGYEKVNGIVYQAVPDGSFTGSFGIYTTGGNSGQTIWADFDPGRWASPLTVSSSQTQVEFDTGGTSSVETYTMAPYQGGTPTPTPTGTLTTTPTGTQTATLTPTFTPTGTRTNTPTFTPTTQTTYNIVVTQSANGTIAPSGTVTVNAGANQKFTITPSSGYHVATLTVDGSSVTAATSYTFSNVTAAIPSQPLLL